MDSSKQGTLIFTINQGNAPPQTCLQINLMATFSQLRFPFPRQTSMCQDQPVHLIGNKCPSLPFQMTNYIQII